MKDMLNAWQEKYGSVQGSAEAKSAGTKATSFDVLSRNQGVSLAGPSVLVKAREVLPSQTGAATAQGRPLKSYGMPSPESMGVERMAGALSTWAPSKMTSKGDITQGSRSSSGCGCGGKCGPCGNNLRTGTPNFPFGLSIRASNLLRPFAPPILRGGPASMDRTTCQLINERIESMVDEFRLAWYRRRAIADALFRCSSERGPFDCYSFQVQINRLTAQIVSLQAARATAESAAEREAIDREIATIDMARAALYEPQRQCDNAASAHTLSEAERSAECERLFVLYSEAVVEVSRRGDTFLRSLENFEHWVTALNREGLGCVIEDHGQDRWRDTIRAERDARSRGQAVDTFPLARSIDSLHFWGVVP